MKDLAEVLKNYGVSGEVVKTNQGPLIKQIEFAPAPGTKIKTIVGYINDIARELGVNSLRVEPIENSNNLGFEVPSDKLETIDFNQILSSEYFENAKGDLPLCLGVDIIGNPFFADLAKMPHLLVAGTTGSGKSVGLNTFILSLIKTKTPEDLRLVLIDPKKIEFSIYNNQKYMLYPVVTDNQQAADVLTSLVAEMERRYSLFEQSLSKNIGDYNSKAGHLPYIVCVIDEFSDLIMSNKDVDKSIIMLAQKARAAGIHIILATQRPSVDVVTGVMKANFPTRLSYKVASSVDSRTILDSPGAESLIGRGDSLFLASDGDLKRIHGAYMPDDAIVKMLEPFRSDVKVFTKPEEPTEVVSSTSKSSSPTTNEKPKKSLFRQGLDMWGSLRQKDKKVIIAGATSLIGYFLGKGKK